MKDAMVEMGELFIYMAHIVAAPAAPEKPGEIGPVQMRALEQQQQAQPAHQVPKPPADTPLTGLTYFAGPSRRMRGRFSVDNPAYDV